MPRCIVGVALAFVFASLTSACPLDGQRWVVPRTADGRPDLEGVWENNSATPLERPRQLADKPRLSDEELASLERRARTLFGPDAEATFGDALYLTLLADTRPAGLGATGSYSQNWLPDRYFEHRTSLIVDPADGKLPPPTPAGARLRAAAAGTVRTGWRLGAGHVAPGSLHSLRVPGSVRRIHGGLPHRADAASTWRSRWRRSTTPASSRSTVVRTCRPRCATTWATPAGSGRVTRSSSKPRTSIRRAIRWVATRRSRTKPPARRTLPPRRRRHARVHVHRRQPDDVDEAVDGGDQLEALAR